MDRPDFLQGLKNLKTCNIRLIIIKKHEIPQLKGNNVHCGYAPQPGRVLKKLNARQSEKFLDFLRNPFF